MQLPLLLAGGPCVIFRVPFQYCSLCFYDSLRDCCEIPVLLMVQLQVLCWESGAIDVD